MKKNLAVLLVVLAAVAVLTRLTRNSGEDAAWAALRQDEIRCLEAMWGKPPQVELVPSNGGVQLNLRQSYSVDVSPARRRWSYDVAWLVARRHPQVQVTQVSLLDATSGGIIPQSPTPDDRSELLRRQRQSQADQMMPGTLVLLDIAYAPARYDPQLQNRVAPPSARLAPREQERSGARREMDSALESAPSPPPSSPISTTCWLVTPSDPPPALVDQLKPIERIVRLPNP